MKSYKRTKYLYLCSIAICFGLVSCSKMDATYKDFVKDGLIMYSPRMDSLMAFGGRDRVMLSGLVPSRAVAYTVYWNNGKDSLVRNVHHTGTESDFVNVIIVNLTEGTYFFEIVTVDKDGHLSVPASVRGMVYGDRYVQSLRNRRVDAAKPGAYDNSSFTAITLNFEAPPDTVNITTEIDYTDSTGTARTASLSPDSSAITLSSYKTGSKILYRSSYKPITGAIDSFNVAVFDTVPEISVLCDKSQFAVAVLQGDCDLALQAPVTSVNWMWDGLPSGYPNVVGTGEVLPLTYTIDLGRNYTALTKFEEWGRIDYGGFNPSDMEVWGIADTTGASTMLPASDPGWSNESVGKGWTLLGHLVRSDGGTAGYQINLLQNVPAVRFIRMRFLGIISQGTAPIFLSEISFWYNP